MTRLATLCVALLVACHAGAPPANDPGPAPGVQPAPVPVQPAPTPTPTPTPVPSVPPPHTVATLGAKCGDGDACPTGQECASYRGIAGARGPLFKTCEIRCADDAGCPADHKCRTIADGPGRVCR